MEPSLEQVQAAIAATITEVGNLLLQKNKEYGNSALNPRRTFANLPALDTIKVRIDDKLSRIEFNTRGGQQELKEDTLLDLIGYLILYRVAQKFPDTQPPVQQ